MSIADHFEQAPDASFVRDFNAVNARRQFRLSATLVAVILFAVCALGAVIRFDTGSRQALAPVDTGVPPAYAGRL